MQREKKVNQASDNQLKGLLSTFDRLLLAAFFCQSILNSSKMKQLPHELEKVANKKDEI